jgi:hypothetical protein
MSKNYYISHAQRVDIKDLIGTRHFTAGQKVFTFVMPIHELFEQFDAIHIIYDEDSNKLSWERFIMVDMGECDKVVYEKGKP